MNVGGGKRDKRRGSVSAEGLVDDMQSVDESTGAEGGSGRSLQAVGYPKLSIRGSIGGLLGIAGRGASTRTSRFINRASSSGNPGVSSLPSLNAAPSSDNLLARGPRSISYNTSVEALSVSPTPSRTVSRSEKGSRSEKVTRFGSNLVQDFDLQETSAERAVQDAEAETEDEDGPKDVLKPLFVKRRQSPQAGTSDLTESRAIASSVNAMREESIS